MATPSPSTAAPPQQPQPRSTPPPPPADRDSPHSDAPPPTPLMPAIRVHDHVGFCAAEGAKTYVIKYGVSKIPRLRGSGGRYRLAPAASGAVGAGPRA